jgi:3',5'-cyclic AMP phosphodiesterase CpdA
MRIVLVSDTHLAPRAAAFAANWAVVAAWIDRTAPDLVVNLGDITADGAGDAAQLDAAAAVLAPIRCPMRFLPGNHDIGDNPLDTGPSSDHPIDFVCLAQYRRVFGADRWTFTVGSWQIVGLNAQLFATETDEEAAQVAWLEDVLAQARGPLGVMLHKPLFRSGPYDTEAHIRYVPASARRRLLDRLARRDLRFVISGHVHQARRLHVLGVEHAWAPSTAFCFPDAVQEPIGDKVVGVLTLKLGEAGHEIDRVTPEGLARHNLMDHPEVYPQVAAIKARLGPHAML